MSKNNLDVGDMDRDGDVDLVTCEHTMPDRDTPAPGGIKLEIRENDGRGHFMPRTVDREKESHLGGQLIDLDVDGDLGIVSIASVTSSICTSGATTLSGEIDLGDFVANTCTTCQDSSRIVI